MSDYTTGFTTCNLLDIFQIFYYRIVNFLCVLNTFILRLFLQVIELNDSIIDKLN